MEEKLRQSVASLLKRIFMVESSAQELTHYFMSLYISSGTLIPGTLVDRAVSLGLSPVRSAFVRYKRPSSSQNCGIVDSLRTLIMHEHFIKPYSEQHILTSLLTRSF